MNMWMRKPCKSVGVHKKWRPTLEFRVLAWMLYRRIKGFDYRQLQAGMCKKFCFCMYSYFIALISDFFQLLCYYSIPLCSVWQRIHHGSGMVSKWWRYDYLLKHDRYKHSNLIIRKEPSHSFRFIHMCHCAFVCSWLLVFLCGLGNRSRDAWIWIDI